MGGPHINAPSALRPISIDSESGVRDCSMETAHVYSGYGKLLLSLYRYISSLQQLLLVFLQRVPEAFTSRLEKNDCLHTMYSSLHARQPKQHNKTTKKPMEQGHALILHSHIHTRGHVLTHRQTYSRGGMRRAGMRVEFTRSCRMECGGSGWFCPV